MYLTHYSLFDRRDLRFRLMANIKDLLIKYRAAFLASLISTGMPRWERNIWYKIPNTDNRIFYIGIPSHSKDPKPCIRITVGGKLYEIAAQKQHGIRVSCLTPYRRKLTEPELSLIVKDADDVLSKVPAIEALALHNLELSKLEEFTQKTTRINDIVDVLVFTDIIKSTDEPVLVDARDQEDGSIHDLELTDDVQEDSRKWKWSSYDWTDEAYTLLSKEILDAIGESNLQLLTQRDWDTLLFSVHSDETLLTFERICAVFQKKGITLSRDTKVRHYYSHDVSVCRTPSPRESFSLEAPQSNAGHLSTTSSLHSLNSSFRIFPPTDTEPSASRTPSPHESTSSVEGSLPSLGDDLYPHTESTHNTTLDLSTCRLYNPKSRFQQLSELQLAEGCFITHLQRIGNSDSSDIEIHWTNTHINEHRFITVKSNGSIENATLSPDRYVDLILCEQVRIFNHFQLPAEFRPSSVGLSAEESDFRSNPMPTDQRIVRP